MSTQAQQLSKNSQSLNDLLQRRRNSHQSQASVQVNILDKNYAMLQQANRQTSQMLRQIYLDEHEKYLNDLKNKLPLEKSPLGSNQQYGNPSSPKFDIMMQRLKNLSSQKKTQKFENHTSSDSYDLDEKGCTGCKQVKEKQMKEQQHKLVKTLEHITHFQSLIGQSEPLNKLFKVKFGSLDKIERLIHEGKYLKLINKLVKVIGQIFKKLISVKVDDVLLTNRSQEFRQSDLKIDNFQTPPQPQSAPIYVSMSPRFNGDEQSNHQYYFAQKLLTTQKPQVHQFHPSGNKKFISQEMHPLRTTTTQPDEFNSSDQQSNFNNELQFCRKDSKVSVQSRKQERKIQLMPSLKMKKSRSSNAQSPLKVQKTHEVLAIEMLPHRKKIGQITGSQIKFS